MGGQKSKLSRTFWPRSTLQLPTLRFHKPRKYRKVLILSLDAAGKTTFLYRIKTGQLQNTVPTIGYNHEVVEHKSSIFDFWDLGGQDLVRINWANYFYNVQAVIFLVDSNDRERLNEVRNELRRVEQLLYEFHRMDAVVLILANKQDLPEAMKYHEIHSYLFHARSQVFHWEIKTCCIKTGAGVMESLDWLHRELKQRFC